VFLYATACYMVFDVETGMLKYANAGHPVPLHLQKTDATARWLMTDESMRGPALAISEEGGFKTFEQQLAPGDTVLMYTDGLYEVLDAGGREFGEDRLLKAAGQHVGAELASLFPALINEARHFAEEGEFDDDICMVGLKYR